MNNSPDQIFFNNEKISVTTNTGFITSVYGWMTMGIFITFLTSLFTALTLMFAQPLAILIFNPISLILIVISEIALVITISRIATKANPVLSAALFFLYSFLTGLTFSVLLLTYSITSVVITFFVTSLMFGIMAIYGFITKQDLTKIGSLAIMGLIGVILASIINIFIASTALDWILTYVGIGIFLVLIAWDTQKIKNLANVMGENQNMQGLAIAGALTLYLDFINLFIRLLQIFGGRRD